MDRDIKRFKIVTLGCKVNQYESFAIKESFLHKGLEEGKNYCDFIVINTCAVTSSACHQSRQVISKLVKENPNATILITGCYVDLYPSELKIRFNSANLIPTKYKLDIFRFTEDLKTKVELLKPSYFPLTPPTSFGRARAYLKIQDGCEGKCTYCVVPIARGAYKSLEREKLLNQVEFLEQKGYREIVLTGIHLGKYGFDLGDITLRDILIEILNTTNNVKLRLSSIEPTELTKDLLELVKASERICRHFHVPLQSGAEEVLVKMGREYIPEEYASIVLDIYSTIPNVGIGSDVIVGFPGEDERAFEKTFNLIKTLPLSYLHVFPFSPRPNTIANSYRDRISHDIVKKRLHLLRALSEEKKLKFMEAQLENYIKFLPERILEDEYTVGHTDNYLVGIMRYKSKILGEWVLGKVKGIENNRLVLEYIKTIDY